MGALLSLFTYAFSILITYFTGEKSFYSLSREEIVRGLIESDPEWLVLQEIDKAIGKQLKNYGKLFI